jgi:hypothetical protein
MQGISRAHLVSEEPLWGPALDDHCQRQRKSHHTEIGSFVEIDPKKIGLEGNRLLGQGRCPVALVVDVGRLLAAGSRNRLNSR